MKAGLIKIIKARPRELEIFSRTKREIAHYSCRVERRRESARSAHNVVAVAAIAAALLAVRVSKFFTRTLRAQLRVRGALRDLSICFIGCIHSKRNAKLVSVDA